MAEKNFRMRRKLADGNFDDYFPETKAANVKMADGATVEAKVTAHLADYANPHDVTASQVGAIPSTEKGSANGVSTLDASGYVPVSQLGNAVKTTNGSYSGDELAKTISVGFTPKLVVILNTTIPLIFITNNTTTGVKVGATSGLSPSVKLVSGGFTIGADASNANYTSNNYTWTAIK